MIGARNSRSGGEEWVTLRIALHDVVGELKYW
jgi:hypothetical protein